MPKFTIFSPALAGLAQDSPSIKIGTVFSTENSNVRIEDGEVLRNKLRLPEIIDENDITYVFPEYIFDIIDPSPNPSDMFVADPSDESDNPSFFDEGGEDELFYILGDQTSLISVGDTIRVSDSVFNNMLYTVEVIDFNEDFPESFPDGRTRVWVLESIPEITDYTGEIWVGTSNVIHQRTLVDDVQDEYLFLFTAKNIFRWDFSAKALTNVWTVVGASGVINWSSDVDGNTVIATNNSDIPLIGTRTADFRGIDTDLGPEVSESVYISRAALIKSYENYTILANVVLSDGTTLPTTFYNSQLNNSEEWSTDNEGGQTDASSFDIEGNDHISGIGTEFEKLIVFKERSSHEVGFTADANIFRIDRLNPIIGCVAPDSILNDANGKLYYLATDKTIKTLREGEVSQKISSTITSINDELTTTVKGAFVDEFSQLWWAIPTGSTSTNNNKIIVLDSNGIWNFIDINVASFGQYSRVETQTWKNIQFPNWESWDETWNSIKQNQGFPIDLVSDFQGRVFASHESALDIDSVFTGSFVMTTDLAQKQALPIYKRMVNSEWYFRPGGEGDTITISIKDSNKNTYTEIGVLDIANTNGDNILILYLPMDIRNKSFDIKVSATNPFSFIGCVLEFYGAGSR